MNIGMVLDGSYPSDIRVRKEAESLSEFHNVFILCVKNKGEDSYEKINGVQIIRMMHYKSLMHRGILDVVNALFFIHPIYFWKISKFIKTYKIEAIHVHDLPLAKTAYLASRKNKNIKLLLDLHENYPAALRTWFEWRKNKVIKLKNKLFFGYNRWRNFELKIINKYDVLIAVVDEMKERLQVQHKIDKSRIVVVPNSEKKIFAKNFDGVGSNFFQEDNKNQFVISYVGGFGPHRGIHTAIEAMSLISKKIPNSILFLVGPTNRDVKSHLMTLIRKNNLDEFVVIKDKVPFSDVIKIMKSSDINIIPHVSNEHTESAVPHKFYQILLSNKPLLVSDCAPMKRMISNFGIGTSFKANSSESFSDSVIRIFENYDDAKLKARKGYDMALKGKLNWEYTSKKLIELYYNLER